MNEPEWTSTKWCMGLGAPWLQALWLFGVLVDLRKCAYVLGSGRIETLFVVSNSEYTRKLQKKLIKSNSQFQFYFDRCKTEITAFETSL